MQPTHNSIGGLCPLIIYSAGIDPTRFGVMNGVTGEDTGPIFENYNAAAHAAAHIGGWDMQPTQPNGVKMPKNYAVYLAGPMENVSQEQMTSWRNQAKNTLSLRDIEVLDPVRRIHSGQQRHMRRVFELDLLDIRNSDFIIVNLNDDTVPKNGTSMEVFYASYVLRKPVIAFKKEKTQYHPFFESLVTEWCADVEEACSLIINEYLF